VTARCESRAVAWAALPSQSQKRQSQKRERQKQGRAARQEAVLRARQRRSRRNRIIVAGFLALVMVLSIATLVSGGSKKTKVTTAGSTTVPAGAPVSLPKPPDGAAIKGDTPCPKADGSSPRTLHFEKPPPTCISPAGHYTAEIKTNMGTITVVLDPEAAPKTVNNFVVLARYHFFDGISFHRIIPNFVVQGGDPLETGLGDPGYRFEDELPKAGGYKLGSVAMANSGPNTNGSQFFIVSGDTGVQLQPQYSLFGQVADDSLDLVRKIGGLGSPDSEQGAPTAVVTMESVTIKES
jgi:cyclophilin family peptidyl-prolyl cis-trans isomerase/type II secretory pathway pseudopilin PulG